MRVPRSRIAGAPILRGAVGYRLRMYDARQFTMAEIAQSCGVTPMTICRHIITGDGAYHS